MLLIILVLGTLLGKLCVPDLTVSGNWPLISTHSLLAQADNTNTVVHLA